jgi:hypothetical protein
VKHVRLVPIGVLGRRICAVIGVEQSFKAGLRAGNTPPV